MPNKPQKGIFSDREERAIAVAISALAAAVVANTEQRKIEFEWFKSTFGLPTKQDLKETENRIMSAISEFSTRQTAFNTRIDTAVDGLTGDVAALNAKIEELQNTTGGITPEDQALLNDIEARSDAIAAKLEALDALTPPTPPPA